MHNLNQSPTYRWINSVLVSILTSVILSGAPSGSQAAEITADVVARVESTIGQENLLWTRYGWPGNTTINWVLALGLVWLWWVWLRNPKRREKIKKRLKVAWTITWTMIGGMWALLMERFKKPKSETSFLESRMQPDPFEMDDSLRKAGVPSVSGADSGSHAALSIDTVDEAETTLQFADTVMSKIAIIIWVQQQIIRNDYTDWSQYSFDISGIEDQFMETWRFLSNNQYSQAMWLLRKSFHKISENGSIFEKLCLQMKIIDLLLSWWESANEDVKNKITERIEKYTQTVLQTHSTIPFNQQRDFWDFLIHEPPYFRADNPCLPIIIEKLWLTELKAHPDVLQERD